MANPALIDCAKGEWTKIATNVVTGNVWKKKINAMYLQTYRLTGQAAPTTEDEGVTLFQGANKNTEAISAAAAIDVYIWCKRFAGRVRVDL